MTIHFKEVAYGSAEYHELLELRDEVLRKPIGMVLRPKDTELDEIEFHLAAFDGEKIIGCVLLRPLEKHHLKLRQMAVAPDYQGRGIGAQLVRYAEALAVSRGFTSIEANARKTVLKFYEKLGYTPVGEPFMEVSLHTLKMNKLL